MEKQVVLEVGLDGKCRAWSEGYDDATEGLRAVLDTANAIGDVVKTEDRQGREVVLDLFSE
jgi:hypothetical protein